ncbi:type II toxin-antitoxin system antitoxin, RelB/DinJ family, partial [Acinetobacter sp. C_4_1]|nr:type II toxin-antitoxin system antitoxin, RelB/DinJ family [Acinetobacter sp. C_4_1]
VPNTTTVAAMNEADALIQAKKARFETVEDLFNDLEKNSER